MKKFIIKVLFAFSLLGVSSSLLAGCEQHHTHTFEETWTHNETEHWHAATCGHTNEVSNKDEHDYNDNGVCIVCGYYSTETSDGHKHTFANTWTYDETNHWHIATCEHNTEVGNMSPHNFNDFNKCTVCGYQGPLNTNMVDEKTWESAFKKLEYEHNFTLTAKVHEEYHGDTNTTVEVDENVAHACSSAFVEYIDDVYYVFGSEDSQMIAGVNGLYASVSIDMSIDELLEYLGASEIVRMIMDFEEMHDYFEYDEQEKLYKLNVDTLCVTMKFVGNDLYFFEYEEIINQNFYRKLTLDKIGNTLVDVSMLHEHEYSNEWEHNNMYHWHNAICHDGVISAKVAHTWDNDNKCTVCGFEKLSSSTSEVDKAMWEKAFELIGLSNGIIANKINGELRFESHTTDSLTMINEQLNNYQIYFENDGDNVWRYFKTQQNDWEKTIIEDYSDILEQKLCGPAFIDYFSIFKDLYDEFSYVDGLYIANGIELQFYNYSQFTYINGVSADVKIKFNDGEIQSIKIYQVVLDNDNSNTCEIELELGSANVTLPDAKIHEHSWNISQRREDYHRMICESCGDSQYNGHTYIDGVCSVCGVKDHEHVYDTYVPYDYDFHIFACECGSEGAGGVIGFGHNFDENDICRQCGAERHYHDFEVLDSDYNFHLVYCKDCQKRYENVHTFDENEICVVCGASMHHHEQLTIEQYDDSKHAFRCLECGQIAKLEFHTFDENNICTVCNAEKHICVADNGWYITEIYHEGYCRHCDSNFREHHDFKNGVCTVCGVKDHEHTYNVEMNIRNEWHVMCCECGMPDWNTQESHEFDETDHCIVCGAEKHYHNWQFEHTYTYDDHQMYCEDCHTVKWFEHIGDYGDRCPVCGYEIHEHVFDEVTVYNSSEHRLECIYCYYSKWEAHRYDDTGVCVDCGYYNDDYLW